MTEAQKSIEISALHSTVHFHQGTFPVISESRQGNVQESKEKEWKKKVFWTCENKFKSVAVLIENWSSSSLFYTALLPTDLLLCRLQSPHVALDTTASGKPG